MSNAVVAKVLALLAHDGTSPEGAIIVKAASTAPNLEITAIMQKRDDGWYWAEYDSDGNPDYSGHRTFASTAKERQRRARVPPALSA